MLENNKLNMKVSIINIDIENFPESMKEKQPQETQGIRKIRGKENPDYILNCRTPKHEMILKLDKESQIIYHRMIVIPTPGYSTAIMGGMIIIIA